MDGKCGLFFSEIFMRMKRNWLTVKEAQDQKVEVFTGLKNRTKENDRRNDLLKLQIVF